MKKSGIISVIIAIVICCSFDRGNQFSAYRGFYNAAIKNFEDQQESLLEKIKQADCRTDQGKARIKEDISDVRLRMKGVDFWLRYFEPVAYNRINGPLPVEWENEVFEKFEPPYKRIGSGLSLAELYLDQSNVSKDSLVWLVQASIDAVKTFQADSITRQLDTFDHFYYANRLFLLNLSAIYTTSFECPNPRNVIPELRSMLTDVQAIYMAYNKSFPAKPLTNDYLDLYNKMISYVRNQPSDYTQFDHFTFIKDYVNPLFSINQKLIVVYDAMSENNNDYTLNNSVSSIFDKSLYAAQNTKGIYSLINDPATLDEIKHVGKLLFYDPILSGNNQRSCISCHKSTQYFADTTVATSLQYNGTDRLPRNTPSLVNVIYNHLIMLDGKHISLQAQGKAVICNPVEMGGVEDEVVNKVMSCEEYKMAFKKFLKLTPEEHKVTMDHIVSAITYYYGDFSNFYSPFDDVMNKNVPVDAESVRGFNLFMGKARCGTCHFTPEFNGVKPPYISSEFEVLGVPEDAGYHKLSADKGRYVVNPAYETANAFRTGSIRNAQYTKPYMHNGVFNTLEQVIDFYDAGGGVGNKLAVENQTLATDSLKLTAVEKKELISFIKSLNEKIIFQKPPEKLPESSNSSLNKRKVGGEY